MISSRTLTLLAALALTPALAGCPISQPIVVTFPADADWTFTYRDALGEQLGAGKAKVALMSTRVHLNILFTEAAFGDHARMAGELTRAPSKERRWTPFTGTGRWFSGEDFSFAGCMDLSGGEVAAGAVAYRKEASGALKDLLENPCSSDGTSAEQVRRFDPALVDKVFTWSARLSAKKR